MKTRLSLLIVFAVGVSAALLGAYVALTVAGTHQSGLGLWLRDFAKSPGAAALAALVAATIAFRGISRQVAVSQGNLNLEKDREQDRSWWQSFEWAASRGFPLDKKHRPLPVDVSINTFNALQQTALTNVQRSACAGILDVLSSDPLTDDNAPAPTSTAGSSAPGSEAMRAQDERTVQALSSYVESSAGTAAASSMAEFRLYEFRVVDALHDLVSPTVGFSPDVAPHKLNTVSSFRPDAVMTVEDRDVIVEIKHVSQPLRAVDRLIARTVESIRGKGLTDPVLIVTDIELEIPDSVRVTLAVETVRWNGPEDDKALKVALERASRLSPWRPNDLRWASGAAS